ncbi:glycosyltransferase family A protein [Cellulomonas aerilata]|uniref:glycosyltransferase family 2 protein n=1 Tax=Cellulomonas aerilata TaxID=515326 RepID=UPI0031D7B519
MAEAVDRPSPGSAQDLEGDAVPAQPALPVSQSVTVAVLTYRRPGDLAAVLPALDQQARTLDPPAGVLVVDNDPDGGARTTVVDHGSDLVRYVHEPEPGIAAARNRALTEAGTDLLVFIDDDERPSEHWLVDLVRTYLVDRPAAVVGPVVSEYERDPDAWVAAGRFFDRRRLPTGTTVELAATNNLLLDLAQVRREGLTFDLGLGITGGSDTLFTRQLTRAGGRLVWCDSALVVDVVPASRLSREWVLRRAFRSGNSWSHTSLLLAASPRERAVQRAVLTTRGTIRVVAGAARAGVGAVTGSLPHRVRGVRTVARGAGLVAGAWGSVYSEYRRP